MSAQPAPTLWNLAVKEHAEAVSEFCGAVAAVSDQIGRGKKATSQQTQQAQAARLRLDNANAVFTLGICRRAQ
jgi:hypothetical protein